MNYLLIGFLGFVTTHLSDLLAVRRIRFAKPSVWVIGALLIGYAAVMAFFWPEKLPLPAWTTWLGWVLLATSFPLLLYSLFVNLPFFDTYVSAGTNDRLITTGLYALVRHPWVHWHILVTISLVLASRSQLMLYAMPLFIVLDIIAAAIQDRFFFPRIFPDYDEYRRKIPMLIPSVTSARAFIRSVRQPKNTSAKPTPEEASHVRVS